VIVALPRREAEEVDDADVADVADVAGAAAVVDDDGVRGPLAQASALSATRAAAAAAERRTSRFMALSLGGDRGTCTVDAQS
jgi:hypothetical protein